MSHLTRRDFLKGLPAAALLSLRSATCFGEAIPVASARLPSSREMVQIASVAQQFIDRFRAPGLSVAIARHGQMVLQQGFGHADPSRRELLMPSHTFRIASVSKPITSAAVFVLIEQKMLRLDDPAFGPGALLPIDVTHFEAAASLRKITVYHLLTHTAGGWGNKADDPMFAHADMSQRDLIGWTLRTHPLKHSPGEHFDYSNFGYCLLGRIIERMTGLPYTHAVAKLLLEKCGIRAMRLAGNTLAEKFADEVEYAGQNGENPYNINVKRMDAHGGWIASPTDLVKFVMHVDGFTTTRNVLRADTIKTMTTATSANENYACGWAVNKASNWWHLGSLPGVVCLAVRTASGLCWAAATNTRAPGIDLALDETMWKIVKAVSAWKA